MKEKMLMGIDWGTKRIGLALGDNITKIANPYGVVKNLAELLEVIKTEDIDEIVIGEPLKMKDNKLATDERYADFVNKLKKMLDVPVTKVDERLSSKQADSLVGCKKTKASRDALAAMLILQSYFDKSGN